MSRLGKKPIALPSGVSVTFEPKGRIVEIKGPKGALRWVCPPGFLISQTKGSAGGDLLKVAPENLSSEKTAQNSSVKALWGLTRSKIQGMVSGVTQGFSKVLEIQGVGFKARLEGQKLVLSLGASHPVVYELSSGVTATVDPKQTIVTISGCDKELVGRAASSIRVLRPPEPYKGKGIRYGGEFIARKAGKTAVTAGTGGAKK